MSSDHSISCVLLAASRNIIENGFFDVIKHGLSNKSCTISSNELCKLIHSLLLHKQVDILNNINYLIDIYCNNKDNSTNKHLFHDLLTNMCGSLFTKDNMNTTANLNSCIAIDLNNKEDYKLDISNNNHLQHRKLISTRGLGRGNIVLNEYPMISCIKSKCNCHEKIIKVEYLTISWITAIVIALDKLVNESNLSSNDKLIWQLFDFIPFTTIQKRQLAMFMNNFQHKLSANVNDPWDTSSHHPFQYQLWSLDIQVLMCTIAAICVIYTNDLLLKLDPSTKLATSLDPLCILHILSRLPTNIHAIYFVNETITNNERIVEQSRLGYGLFINASSINHSCKPCASIRYNFNTMINKSNNKYNLLKHCNIEIVINESISNNSEITISYGPMYGVHNRIERLLCLNTQFLFECHCNGCTSESLSTNPLHHNVNKILNQIHLNNELVENTKFLCEEIENFNQLVKEVNKEISDIICSNDLTKIQSYLNDRIQPLVKHLDCLYVKNFSNYTSKTHDSNESTIDKHVYREFCVIYTILLDIKGRLLNLLDRFIESSECIELTIHLFISSNIYHKNDIAIARERVKLSQLYVSSGNYNKCRYHLNKAIKYMTNMVDSNDPDWIEALCIHRFISNISGNL